MTERNDGLLPKDEQQLLLEMPSDSVLIAEANRDFYESVFIFSMIRTSDMPIELCTPAEKKISQQARIAQVKMMLSSSEFDVQKVVDSIDINRLSQDTIDESILFGVVTKPVPVEEYQIENFVRTSANIVTEKVSPDFNSRIKKGILKRFKEAKRLAVENHVPDEDVFNDQELYFELVRRSTSPEDVISQTKETIKLYKDAYIPLIRNEFRFRKLIANADDSTKTVDKIDKEASEFISTPHVKSDAEKELSQFEDQMLRYSHAIIERYWGSKIAKLFI